MSDIVKTVGQRIRQYRAQSGLSQEQLAELSGFHPTYIGQLERGEKNATLESIERVSMALKIPLSRLFENIGTQGGTQENIPLDCYEFLSSKSIDEQKALFKIMCEIDNYKSK